MRHAGEHRGLYHHHERHEAPHHHGGRGGHDGGRGTHGGRGHARMERGALRFVLLDLLREGPRHGYEMIRELEERTHGQYAPSPGALYPTLQYLTDLGLVSAVQEAERRVYELAEAGRAEWEANKDRVDAFWARFASEAPSKASQREVAFLQDAMEDLSRTVWSGLQEAIARGDHETLRSARRAVEACQEAIRTLIVDVSPASGAPEAGEARFGASRVPASRRDLGESEAAEKGAERQRRGPGTGA
jgi:DNA-binding PadR family transcriptional regulator